MPWRCRDGIGSKPLTCGPTRQNRWPALTSLFWIFMFVIQLSGCYYVDEVMLPEDPVTTLPWCLISNTRVVFARKDGRTCPGHWISRYGIWPIFVLMCCGYSISSPPPHRLYLQIPPRLTPLLIEYTVIDDTVLRHNVVSLYTYTWIPGGWEK